MCILIKFSAVALYLSLSLSLSLSLALSVLPFLVGLLPVSQATLGLKGAFVVPATEYQVYALQLQHNLPPARPAAVINHLSCLKTWAGACS